MGEAIPITRILGEHMKPILFNTEMVRAILDGRKTVTRRCVKNVPSDFIFGGWKENSGNNISYGECMFFKGEKRIYVKPKYLTGDILYVRETWSKYTEGRIIYKADLNTYELNASNSFIKWKPSIHMPKKQHDYFCVLQTCV